MQLAAIRATLAILADHGAALPPPKARAYLDAIERAAEPYLRGLSEPNAQLFTGRSSRWLRGRYVALAAWGLAWTRAGVRYYAECALPHRHDDRRSMRHEPLDVAALADELLADRHSARAPDARRPRRPRSSA